MILLRAGAVPDDDAVLLLLLLILLLLLCVLLIFADVLADDAVARDAGDPDAAPDIAVLDC